MHVPVNIVVKGEIQPEALNARKIELLVVEIALIFDKLSNFQLVSWSALLAGSLLAGLQQFIQSMVFSLRIDRLLPNSFRCSVSSRATSLILHVLGLSLSKVYQR